MVVPFLLRTRPERAGAASPQHSPHLHIGYNCTETGRGLFLLLRQQIRISVPLALLAALSINYLSLVLLPCSSGAARGVAACY
eukprot:scaffold7389_cov48-Phaeocystis_antarctica.AAC.2